MNGHLGLVQADSSNSSGLEEVATNGYEYCACDSVTYESHGRCDANHLFHTEQITQYLYNFYSETDNHLNPVSTPFIINYQLQGEVEEP